MEVSYAAVAAGTADYDSNEGVRTGILMREVREGREVREVREGIEGKEGKEVREVREGREGTIYFNF